MPSSATPSAIACSQPADFSAVPLLLLTAVAAALVVLGVAAFRRRDVRVA